MCLPCGGHRKYFSRGQGDIGVVHLVLEIRHSSHARRTGEKYNHSISVKLFVYIGIGILWLVFKMQN